MAQTVVLTCLLSNLPGLHKSIYIIVKIFVIVLCICNGSPNYNPHNLVSVMQILFGTAVLEILLANKPQVHDRLL